MIWDGQQAISGGAARQKVNKIPIKSAIDSAFFYIKHRKGFLCSKDFLSGISSRRGDIFRLVIYEKFAGRA